MSTHQDQLVDTRMELCCVNLQKVVQVHKVLVYLLKFLLQVSGLVLLTGRVWCCDELEGSLNLAKRQAHLCGVECGVVCVVVWLSEWSHTVTHCQFC